MLIFWLPSLVLTIDWAINRRDIQWLFALAMLGPLGALAYTIYHWESITFPFPIARTLRRVMGRQGAQRCSRCQRQVPALVTFQDARTVHFVCPMCASELEITRKL